MLHKTVTPRSSQVSSFLGRYFNTKVAKNCYASQAAAVVESPPLHSTIDPQDTFAKRHIGPNDKHISQMLQTLQCSSLHELVLKCVPADILLKSDLKLDEPLTESSLLKKLKSYSKENILLKTFIGMGYYNAITPNVILRNIMENPGWYTQYTPYQPEISQGRLESLLNYQTMVCELTKMDMANASLLDEGTAAGEALNMFYSASDRKKNKFLVDVFCFPQTIACLQTRAKGFGIQVEVADLSLFDMSRLDEYCGALIQYPNSMGEVKDYEGLVKSLKEKGVPVACATDLMALTMLKPPGEFGVDIAFGNSQRFGVPLGFGGPHAAFFAVKDEFKRKMPGRLVGVSKDSSGKKAFRLTLQTREQHIRREKATSNICTSQALLANMAAMYAVYHGPVGLKKIARRIHHLTAILAENLKAKGFQVLNRSYFDTIIVEVKDESLYERALQSGVNLRKIGGNLIGISLDETCSLQDVQQLSELFIGNSQLLALQNLNENSVFFNASLKRESKYMQHPVFNSYHSETEMMRYISRLQSKDLSLLDAMIPLGSCTMKLNSATEMIPVTWPEFSQLHPFVPQAQSKGYQKMLKDLEKSLAVVTGFDAVSLQPNSGAQGEYAGLCVIRAYFENKGQGQRNICLIPVSAHGTNPASAIMAGMSVVPIKCDSKGNLDLSDLKNQAEKHKDNLAAIMVTYPSTFGVFEPSIRKVCEIVHEFGGQVYMDGANLNAQIGICTPGDIGADVCHLNLHKTFCIPHGGGGPGMGPIGVKSHLAPFLPGHPVIKTGGESSIGPISAAPFGSASILPIPWAYINMMGSQGLKKATQVALLNANYMAERLKPFYKILYTNEKGMVAHEFIIDARVFKESAGIEAIDIAKRLQDYSFHSPTMSWPVTNTLMVEPTESESLWELNRFVDSLIQIRKEIALIESGKWSKTDNPLKNAPHTMEKLLGEWKHPYTREEAAYPMPGLRESKFWPSVGRIDDTFGDRNLMCSCPPVANYTETE